VIISASRRTDIPAFYSEWLMNRLREGYALVPNPRDPSHYRRITLTPDVVDCIVFWTKNPAPMLSKLPEISQMGYPFYFQFTLTPYGKEMECNLPSKCGLLKTFQALSNLLGANRIVWRYDPVIFTETMDIGYHRRHFEQTARALEGYTHRCIFSFLDLYPKVKRHLQGSGCTQIQAQEMLRIAESFSEIAQKHRMRLFCCEQVDLNQFGIAHASCIDASMVEDILGCRINVRKDANQRPACGCIESIDIGSYDCCPHGCKYCYGASSPENIQKNYALHDPSSPVLTGRMPDASIITEKAMVSVKDHQLRLI
jgi:hypothetical protein